MGAVPRLDEIVPMHAPGKHAGWPGEHFRLLLEGRPEHPDQRAQQHDEGEQGQRVKDDARRREAPSAPRAHRARRYSRPDRSCSHVTTRRNASRQSVIAEAYPKCRNSKPCIWMYLSVTSVAFSGPPLVSASIEATSWKEPMMARITV